MPHGDVVAWVGGAGIFLTGCALIWNYVIAPISKALWAAVLAAPKIADGIGDLIAIVQGDVLGRLDAGTQRFDRIDHRLDDHEVRIVDLEKRPTPIRPDVNVTTEGSET